MGTGRTVIDRFGRVVIPKDLREATGLRPGTPVELSEEGGGLRLVPGEEKALLREVDGVLVAVGEATGDLAATVKALRHVRTKRIGRPPRR